MEQFDLSEKSLKQFGLSLLQKLRKYEMPIFLCVGSDKYVCDSLAPIISEMLTKKYNIPAYVYGGLDYNINANNLIQALSYIETEHPNNPKVLIDATLGDNVGKVILTSGSYAGMGKVLPIKKIGNFSILGVVNHKYKTFDLNSTKLKAVLEIAKFISKGIAMVCEQLYKEKLQRKLSLTKVI